MERALWTLAHLVLITTFVVVYVRLATGEGALRASLDVWRELPRRPTFRFAVAVWLSVFLLDLWQTRHDQALLATTTFNADFTPFFHRLEGDLPASIQSFLAFPPLTWMLALAYFILFPAFLIGSAHAYDRQDDLPGLRMTAYVYVMNYMLCIPFYLFFPVREPILYSEANVLPLSDNHVDEWLINLIRPMSGVDNCFPSYHTSLTVSLVLIAVTRAPRPLARAAVLTGAMILLSTVYLGFHWVLDVLGGTLAGWFVFAVARRLAEAGVLVPVTEGPSRS